MLARLLDHPSSDTFEITALVRSPNKAKILIDKFDINAIVGSHADYNEIQKIAEDSHVIFHTVRACCVFTFQHKIQDKLTISWTGRC